MENMENIVLDPDYRGPFRSGINGYRSKENIMEFAIKKKFILRHLGYIICGCTHQDRYSLIMTGKVGMEVI